MAIFGGWVPIPFLVVVFALFIDFFLRHTAFRRVDSVALGVGFFSLAYCVVEIARPFVNANGPTALAEVGEWLTRASVVLICLFIMAYFHQFAAKQMSEQLSDLLESAAEASSVPNARRLMAAAAKVTQRSILVSFSPPESRLRQGKRHWRVEVAELINEMFSLEGDERVQQEDIALPAAWRWGGLILFFLLSMVCVFAVGWQSS